MEANLKRLGPGNYVVTNILPRVSIKKSKNDPDFWCIYWNSNTHLKGVHCTLYECVSEVEAWADGTHRFETQYNNKLKWK